MVYLSPPVANTDNFHQGGVIANSTNNVLENLTIKVMWPDDDDDVITAQLIT